MFEWPRAEVRRLLDPREHVALAAELVAQLPQTDIRAQLTARRIQLVAYSNRLNPKYLYGCIQARKQHFTVLLSSGHLIKKQLFTVGHEIGHTYAFFPEVVDGTARFHRTYMSCTWDQVEQKFCDEFARQWVRTCGWQRELRELLTTESRVVVNVVLGDIDPTGLPAAWIAPTLSPLTPEEEAELPF